MPKLLWISEGADWHRAESRFGTYVVAHSRRWFWYLGEGDSKRCDSLEDAQAACQKHFDNLLSEEPVDATAFPMTPRDTAMYKALEATLSWMTNVNVNDPATLGRQIMAALELAGHDKEELDDAAVALVRGPCAVPNLIGDWEDDEEFTE